MCLPGQTLCRKFFESTHRSFGWTVPFFFFLGKSLGSGGSILEIRGVGKPAQIFKIWRPNVCRFASDSVVFVALKCRDFVQLRKSELAWSNSECFLKVFCQGDFDLDRSWMDLPGPTPNVF